jgi:hypothetical protein
MHINCLELKTILYALHTWTPFIKDLQVMITTDNTSVMSVVSYINKQGGMHSRTLITLAQELLLWLSTHAITLRARHIPDHFNVITHRLSRCHQVLKHRMANSPDDIISSVQPMGNSTEWTCSTCSPQSKKYQFPLFISPISDPQA